jgi:Tat protein translocase TatB subunit
MAARTPRGPEIMNVGPAEILVILVVALVAVGPARLPSIARKVGGGLREVRQLQETVLHGLDDDATEPHRQADSDATTDRAP